jgi:hypothetical protein
MNPYSDAYTHLPLDEKLNHVRLLELQPGPRGTEIRGRLIRSSLADMPLYEALSYTWGPSNNSNNIRLGQINLAITDNLAAALEVLRCEAQVRTLWIDAICINQQNLDERSQQVQLMREIYRNAKRVVVWIDVHINPTSSALEILQEMNENSTQADLGRVQIWEDLQPLFKNNYWNRVWIQQEISFASSLLFQINTSQVSAYSIYHFLRLFDERRDSVDFSSVDWVNWATLHPNIHLPPRFGRINSCTEPMIGSTFSDHDLNLLSILSSSYKLECTDNRDRIYGLMYLANDFVEGDIVVDYNVSVTQVYTSFAEFVLRKMSSLNFLLEAGMGKQVSQAQNLFATPSWVPDWTRAPKSIVGPELDFSHCNTVARSASPVIRPGSEVLEAYGLRLTTVQTTIDIPSAMELYNTSIAAFLEICWSLVESACKTSHKTSQDSGSDEDKLLKWDALVKVLTAVDNYFPNDENKRKQFRHLLVDSANRLRSAFFRPQNQQDAQLAQKLPMSKLVGEPSQFPSTNNSAGERGDIGQTWFRMMVNVMIRHIPFVGIGGEIGLLPRSAASGDEVWMVLGCERVLILHPQGKLYQVVGEGYLDGFSSREMTLKMKEDISVGEFLCGFMVEPIEFR